MRQFKEQKGWLAAEIGTMPRSARRAAYDGIGLTTDNGRRAGQIGPQRLTQNRQPAPTANNLAVRSAYSLFPMRVSIFLHLVHSKECNSKPGRSGSIPNNSISVPHLEQAGRSIELECGVAGW